MDFQYETERILEDLFGENTPKMNSELAKFVELLVRLNLIDVFHRKIDILSKEFEEESNPLELPEEFKDIYEKVFGLGLN